MYEGKPLKDKLQAGKICFGTWVGFIDPMVTELLTGSGYDFLIVDSEHGPLDIEAIMHHCMATKGTDVVPIVRVAWNDIAMIKRALDVGAGGILIPFIRTPEDTENAVKACLYPPAGIRGFGPRRPGMYGRKDAEYIPIANENILIWAQIEHIDAVNNIEGIVAIPGVTSVFIGSNDLSGSMGLLGQPRHPDVLAAIDKVIAAAKKAGIPVGIAGPIDPKLVAEWIGKGIDFITLGGDASFFVNASQSAVTEAKKELGI